MATHNDNGKCDCAYCEGQGMAADMILCAASNQWQVARQPDTCLHLLRMSRLERLPITRGQDAIYNERG